MKCSFCTDLAAARNENNFSAFVAGCDNFRIEISHAHEMSDFHKSYNSVNDAKSLAQFLLKRSCQTLIQLSSQ